MNAALPVILFVDDEQPVLDGLRRKLSCEEDNWTMLFASSGAAALDMMDRQPVDVVVSDMRMPGMDGAALLQEVRRRHPAAARFILSGFSEREAILRTLGPAHQYFVKPCDAEALAKAVERTLAIRRRLHAPDLLALVSGARAIPALPQALSQLFEQLQSPNGSAAEVARIIASDVGLTAQVLKLVNSAYFFVPSRVADVLQAVRLLGFELIRSVAVLAGVFESFHTSGIDMAAVKRLGHRSLMIGALARRIAEREKMDAVALDHCQCAGMLAHIGSLILFANRPDQMSVLQKELEASGGEIIAAERHHFGASHPELGACLLSLWGFSDAVVGAVLTHHHPCELSPPADRIDPATVVHVAQCLVKPGTAHQDLDALRQSGLDVDHLGRIGVCDLIPTWAEIAAHINRECP